MDTEEIPPILALPIEVHRILFDQMEQNDKINFGECSKECRKLWRETKSVYEVMTWDYHQLKITLSLNNSYPFSGHSHFLEFSNEHCEYVKLWQTGGEIETRQIRGSKIYFEVARDIFKKKMEKNQSRIRSLTINGPCPINVRKIRHFPKLQYLIYKYGHDSVIQELLPKTGNHLKYLKIEGIHQTDIEQITELPEIYRVEELSIDFGLTAAQMMNLSAKKIEVSIGKLEPEDLYNFIQTWQNGNRNLEKCVWILEKRAYASSPWPSNFPFDTFFRTLFQFYGVDIGNYFYRNLHRQICIRGNCEKSGRITCSYGNDLRVLEFEVFDVKDLADENGILKGWSSAKESCLVSMGIRCSWKVPVSEKILVATQPRFLLKNTGELKPTK